MSDNAVQVITFIAPFAFMAFLHWIYKDKK